MRLVRKDGQFWVGHQLGASVATRWGTLDQPRERTQHFKSVERAKEALAALVTQLAGLGFEREVPEPVIEALQRNPRDTRCLKGLGDQFLTWGDRCGELVALDARSGEKGQAFVERHEGALWRDASTALEGEYLQATWHGGLVYGATLDEFADSPRYTEVVDGWRSMDDDRGGLTTMLAGSQKTSPRRSRCSRRSRTLKSSACSSSTTPS